MSYENERLLIISNNVMSEQTNNGKTIYSYFDSFPKEQISQLYFYGEQPTIDGYKYFRITDGDILKGLFKKEKRGNKMDVSEIQQVPASAKTKNLKFLLRNRFTLKMRDLAWKNHWQSEQLFQWLDEIKPTTIFFVAGDALFPYDICNAIAERYHARLAIEVTDDYIIPYPKESFLAKLHKKTIENKLRETLDKASALFTVSDIMKKEYAEYLGCDSMVINNLTESMQDKSIWTNNDTINLIYAGSLYYQRDDLIYKIAKAAKEYNTCASKKANILVYTNAYPAQNTLEQFESTGCCQYKGNLDKQQLKEELNKADILLFVESFDEEQIRKTRLSLSTKVPEYMSIGKPILAVGPKNIGSMDYLEDVAFVVNSEQELSEKVVDVLTKYANGTLDDLHPEVKFNKLHDKKQIQKEFIEKIFGEKQQ